MRSVGELRVTEVDDLIQDLVDQDKILADCLLVDDSAEILNDGHDAVEELQDVGGRDVEASGGHHVDGGLLEVGKINALDVEDGLGVSLGQLDFSVEEFRSIFDEI